MGENVTSTVDEFLLDQIHTGIDQFNQAQLFECHETLESVWKVLRDGQREFVQGIIQIAVGYYHAGKGNDVGALKLLRRGHGRIIKFVPSFLGVDAEALAQAVSNSIAQLQEAQDCRGRTADAADTYTSYIELPKIKLK